MKATTINFNSNKPDVSCSVAETNERKGKRASRSRVSAPERGAMWVAGSMPVQSWNCRCKRRWRLQHLNMNYFNLIILSLTCACVGAYEPLAVMMDRSRNTYPVYSNDLGDEYEPYAVAAFPINAQMPILQVLSPGYRSTKYRKPGKQRPQRDQHKDIYAYDSSNIENVYEPYSYDNEYVESVAPPKYSKTNPYDDESSSVIVYARPNRHGGYSYRRQHAPHPAPIHAPSYTSLGHDQKPVIIRIQKYRVIH